MRFLISFIIIMTFSSIAKAQDVATEHTQLLNHIELITENLRRLQSLENQIEMIKNQVEGLKSVASYQNNFSDIDALRNNLTNITSQGTALSDQTQAILTQMKREINKLPVSGTMIDQQESLDQGALNIVQNVINRLTQLRMSYQQVIDSVNALMEKNNQSLGQTQALQTSNELAAQSIAQTQSTQELLSEQISMQAAMAVMMAKQAREEKNENDAMKQIFNARDDGSRIFGPLNSKSPMKDGILNQIINQYSGSILNVQKASTNIGLIIFNSIAAIAIALLAFYHLLRKNVDMVDSNLELIKLLIYLDFFYYFIVNYDSISGLFFQAVDQIGNLLGAKASGLGSVTDIKVQDLLRIGFLVAKNIWTLNVTSDLLKDLQMVLIAVLAGAVVLYCFAVIGLELMLVQIGAHIILAGGVFLLAFSGLPWTRDYAERYVHTFFHIGIKMIFIYILIGLGLGLAKTWPQNVPHITPHTAKDWEMIFDYDIAVALSTYIYYKLCLKLPDQAVSWLTGRFPLSFETAPAVNAAVHGAVKGAKEVYQKVKEEPDKIRAFVANRQGNAKAYDAAWQAASAKFKAEGKTASPQDIQRQAVKTLGEAKWDKVVDATDGGKLAKDILESMKKADAGTETKTDIKTNRQTNFNNDPMDFSI